MTPSLILLVGAGLAGVAVALAAAPFAAAFVAPRRDEFRAPDDLRRRVRRRAESAVYRWFEPLVDDLAAEVTEARPAMVDELQKDLDLVQPERDLVAADFFALRRVESAAVLVAAVGFGWVLMGDPLYGLLIGAGGAWVYPYLQVRQAASAASRYRSRLEARLALVADLVGLMLEGGSTLPQALSTAAEENRGHPVGEELARARAAVDKLVLPAQALTGMARRVGSPDLSEMVFMMTTALERGTPVQHALQDMAERLRVRRVQRLERAAEEANVKISGPGLLVMLACLAIIVAPFMLAGAASGR